MRFIRFLNKNILFITFLLIGFLWNLYRIYQNSKHNFYDLTEVIIQNQVINVGIIKKDSIKYVHYVLKNNGKAPIKVIKIEPDCSCTRANIDSSNSNENNLNVKVSFDNSAMGAFDRTVLVHLNTKDSPTVLRLKGFVVK